VRGPRDSELFKDARQGDAAAFDTLIRRHDKHLYRVARSVMSDDHEAEDVVQGGFCEDGERVSPALDRCNIVVLGPVSWAPLGTLATAS